MKRDVRDVFGTSVRGASHIRSDVECQDSHKRLYCSDGSIILAVADGHGSKNCPYSKTGSSIAVKVFCKTMSKYVKRFSDSSKQPLTDEGEIKIDIATYLNREGETKVAQEIDSEWKRLIAEEHKKNNRDFPQIVSGDKCGERDMPKVYEQYGTTLLGLVLANDFQFAFQLGDGDIIFTTKNHVEPVINGDKILGVETHSLSKNDAWKKAITVVRRMNPEEDVPSMFLMSSDGFSNSFKNENEFKKTCSEYFDMINQYGVKTVKENLKSWLEETSAMGCGDDITVLIKYYSANQNSSIHDNDTTKEQIADDPPEMNSLSASDNEEDEIAIID